VEFLRQVQSKVSRLFFILNKVDYLSSGGDEAIARVFRGVLLTSPSRLASLSRVTPRNRARVILRKPPFPGQVPATVESGQSPRHVAEEVAA
jgi:hypothetical protein